MSAIRPSEPATAPASPPGDIALRNLAADAALWLGMVALLFVFRGVLLWQFRGQLADESDAGEIVRCFITGLRFDISIASYAVIPTLGPTLVSFFRPLGPWHRRFRWALALVVTAITVVVFVVDVGYFKEYHDQFNHWIFGLVFDDRRAIANTVWKSYPLGQLALLVVVLIAGLVGLGWAVGRFGLSRLALPARLAVGWGRWLTPLVTLVLLVFGLRASFASRPVQLKAAAATSDPFLNKIVLNPYAALRYAIVSHRTLARAQGLNLILPDGDVRAAAKAWFPNTGAVTNLDDCLKRIAAGSPVKPAQHIFLIVSESFDTWGLRPENQDLHATDRLAALGRAGMAADAFVSGGDNTMASLAAMISGTLETGVHVNYQPIAKEALPTATAAIFKRLGYRTRFFYSGYLSWQRLGDFCRDQGFDEVHSGAEMGARLADEEWGVPDEDLFRFALAQPAEGPTFDMFMTTSYHDPFNVDVEAKGFPRATLAPKLAARGFTPQTTRVLGHLWYADKAMGDFVAAAEKKFPRALFAITGDHWSRRDFVPRPSLFVQRTVPFVLYGPEVLAAVTRPERIVGGHVDIVPTLVELTAPPGFAYHSFGRNLLDPTQSQVGYGNRAVVTPELIADVAPQGQVQDVNGRALPDVAGVEELRLRYRQLHALSWWRVMKGPEL